MPVVVLGLLIVALIGQAHVSAADPNPEARELDNGCPAWFEDAPALGSGRPHPVQVEGLAGVTVCRYLHAFGGGEVVHHPPLQTNLVSEGTLERGRAVRSLAHAFDRLSPYSHPEKEIRFCGNEGSGGFYVRFVYRGGRRVSVRVIPSGCRRAVAGKHGRPLFLPTSLQQWLAAVAPPYNEIH
jgi:hypothetical protein